MVPHRCQSSLSGGVKSSRFLKAVPWNLLFDILWPSASVAATGRPLGTCGKETQFANAPLLAANVCQLSYFPTGLHNFAVVSLAHNTPGLLRCGLPAHARHYPQRHQTGECPSWRATECIRGWLRSVQSIGSTQSVNSWVSNSHGPRTNCECARQYHRQRFSVRHLVTHRSHRCLCLRHTVVVLGWR